MPFKTQLLWIPAALLLTASVALAAPAAPADPQTPSATAGEPLAALSTAGPVCKGADVLVFSPEPQTKATDTCGACSDTACVGKMPNAVCGSGLRCIAGPSCSTVARFRCRCLII